MAYPAQTLITNAWYTSGIVARQLQQASGDQLSDGLNLLNDLLGFEFVDYQLIPYWNLIEVMQVPGQELYFIPNLIDAASVTFNLGPVRFQMARVERKDYFGSPRVDNIQALSFTWNLERVLGGSNLRLYFLPSQATPMHIMGKFGLTSVQQNTDLSTTYDASYITYLRYALAEYMCQWYNIAYLPENKKMLEDIQLKLKYQMPFDFTMSKITSFNATGGLNWGDVNVGRGYRPN